jgi:hypothetical protein
MKVFLILLVSMLSQISFADAVITGSPSKLILCERDDKNVWLYLRTPTEPYPSDVMAGTIQYSSFFAYLTCRPNSWANSEANNDDIYCVGIWNHAIADHYKPLPSQTVMVRLKKNADGYYLAHWINTSSPDTLIRHEVNFCTVK